MQIAFLVCVAAWVHVFGRCLFSRYRFFLVKRCVAARTMSTELYPCPRHMLLGQKGCVAAWRLSPNAFAFKRYRFLLVKWCVTEAVGAVVESVRGVSSGVGTWSHSTLSLECAGR